MAYAFGDPEIRSVLVAVAVIGIFAFNFNVTVPLLVKQTFGGTAADFGLFSGLTGAGAVVGGLIVAHRSRPSPRMLATVCALFGLTVLLVAAAPTQLLAMLAMIPLGATSIAFMATANSTLQLVTVEEMRGRVMALYSIGFLGTTPIGAPLIGAICAVSNPRMGFVVGGVATLGAAVILGLAARSAGPALPPISGAKA